MVGWFELWRRFLSSGTSRIKRCIAQNLVVYGVQGFCSIEQNVVT